MNKITDEEQLVALGFKRCKRSPFMSATVDCFYQKRFDDDRGKKYFLDCLVFDFSTYESAPFDKSFEFEVQLKMKGKSHFNMTFLTDDYDEVVEFIETLFQEGKLDYYELWEYEEEDE